MHPVEAFRKELAQLDHYPAGVVPVPEPIDGTAFFSAGPGLYCEQPPSVSGLPEFPFGGVMFVGHNLDAEGPYRRRLELRVPHGDHRRPMRTWRGLYQLLERAAVDRGNCFFTNAYVGLIAGDVPTGPFPGSHDVEFTRWCEQFLRSQVITMRPRVIAAIGGDARRFMSLLAPQLQEWQQASSMAVHNARIDPVDCAAVALAHPSLYPVSAYRRAFDGEIGVAADAALLRAAISD